MDSRQTEYLQLLQERNRLKKQMQAKSKQELDLEAKERGFSVNIYGANADRNAEKKPSNVHVNNNSGRPLSIAVHQELRSRLSERISPRTTTAADSLTKKDSNLNKSSPRSHSATAKTRGWAKRPDILFGVQLNEKVTTSNISEPSDQYITNNKEFQSQLNNILRQSIKLNSPSIQPNTTSSLKGECIVSPPSVQSPSDNHSESKALMSPSTIRDDNKSSKRLEGHHQTDDVEDEYAEDFENESDDEWKQKTIEFEEEFDSKSKTLDALTNIVRSPMKSVAQQTTFSEHASSAADKESKILITPTNLSPTKSNRNAINLSQTETNGKDVESSRPSSSKISSILDKAYQSKTLTTTTSKESRSSEKRSNRISKGKSRPQSNRENDLNTLSALANGASVDLNQSLIRKLMSLDPKQKEIILSALQSPSVIPNSDPSNTAEATNDQIIYENEVVLNLRVKIMSTWTKSKQGSLTALILRPMSVSESDDIKPTIKESCLNYLNQLQLRVLSGAEYLPVSSDAVRQVNQLIIATKPSQKIFPNDPKTVWRGPLSSEKPLEVSLQGNIAIRSDETAIEVTEATTADELLDGLELIIINGWGNYSCKDVDVYVGYRCIWSGELPDTSLYTNDRHLTGGNRLPQLISDAIVDAQWTKRICGIGKKNFIQKRKNSIPDSSSPQINTEDSLPGHRIGFPLDLPELRKSPRYPSKSGFDANSGELVNAEPVLSSDVPIWLQSSLPDRSIDEGLDLSKKGTVSSISKRRDSKSKVIEGSDPSMNASDQRNSDSLEPTAIEDRMELNMTNDIASVSRRQRRLRQYQEQYSSMEKPPLDPGIERLNSNKAIPPNHRIDQDPRKEEDHLRASLEALSIADRRNLGRLNARERNSSESHEEESVHSKLGDNMTSNVPSSKSIDENSAPVTAMATNVLRRRAKRIQEVNQTVQSTVQNLAHVFSNTHIVLNPNQTRSNRIITQSSPITIPDKIQGSSEDEDSLIAVISSGHSSIQSSLAPSIQPTRQASPMPAPSSSSAGSATLPRGKVLVIEIYTTWGDEYYIGLNGVDIFDGQGRIITPHAGKAVPSSSSNIASVVANPPDINVLPDYKNDPRVATNLIDGVNFTKNDLHLWLAPIGYYKHPQSHSNDTIINKSFLPLATITITFTSVTSISMLRIFNYNKSRTHTQRGVRDCKILLDGNPIFEGEIRIAPGDLLSTDNCSEVVLFTLDETILKPIAEHDEAAGYYTRDLSDEWIKQLQKNIRMDRPTTAEQDRERERLAQRDIGGLSNDPSKNRPTTSVVNAAYPFGSLEGLTKASPLKGSSINKPPTIKEEEVDIDEVINNVTEAMKSTGDVVLTRGRNSMTQPSTLTKAATFSVSSSSDPKPAPLDMKSILYNNQHTILCRRITINILSTWGDANYVGLNGLEILTVSANGTIQTLPLGNHNIEHAEPRDMSAIGCYDDPRVPENLFNGINTLADDRFSWLIPFTPKSNHYLQIDLKERRHVYGLRLWAYNKSKEAILRGVKEISIELDSQLIGYWICRVGSGYDGINPSQLISIHQIIKLFKASNESKISSNEDMMFPGATMISNSYLTDNNEGRVTNHTIMTQGRFIRYISPVIKQDYESPLFPSGLLLSIVIHDNWGDDYFVGLDMIELYDKQGKRLLIDSESIGSITASPYSVSDLKGYENDERKPENLLRNEYFRMILENGQEDGSIESWLAPITHSMTNQERKSSIIKSVPNPNEISQKSPHYLSYSKYYQSLLDEEVYNEDMFSLPTNNHIFVHFNYPITLSAIRFYNYSKTPSRGVKEISIYFDHRLIYMGCLSQHVSSSIHQIIKPQTILFTNEMKFVKQEKDNISYCGLLEQDVLYINERQVMVRSKDMYTRKPSVGAEGVYIDVKNRMDKTLLADATSSDDSPPPGYILNEIARATITSYQASVQAQEYLISRLSKTNPNVKYKALVVIKHICRSGRADFKRDISKNVDAIKECLQFRGPPDPLRGDDYYRRVRDTAKETLDAIFDGQIPMATSAVAAANRIQGIGGGDAPETSKRSSTSGTGIFSSMTLSFRSEGDTEAPYQGHPGATGSFVNNASVSSNSPTSSGTYSGPSTTSSSTANSSSLFVGIGNPNFKDAREEKSWYQRAAQVATSAATSTVPVIAKAFHSSSSSDKKSLVDEDFSNTFASNRGNNAIGSDGYTGATMPQQPQNAISSNAGVSPFGPKSTIPSQGGIVPDFPSNPMPGQGRVGAAVADGRYERAVIQSLCEPAGLKPVPPEDQLKSFLTTVNTLSPDIVGACLIEILNSDAWQSRVKGLIVIAKTVKTSESHSQWWKINCVEELSLLASSDSKVAVRNQAVKTLSALGIVPVAPPPPVPSSVDRSGSRSNGLLFDEDENESVSVGQLSPLSTANNSSMPSQGIDLFSGMNYSGTNESKTVNVFDGLNDLPASAPPAPPASVLINQTASSSQGTNQSIGNAFDFLSESSPATTQSVASTTMMFDNMTLTTPPPPPPTQPVASVFSLPTQQSTQSPASNQLGMNQDLLSLNLTAGATPSGYQQQAVYQQLMNQNLYLQQQLLRQQAGSSNYQSVPSPGQVGTGVGGGGTGFGFINQPTVPRPMYANPQPVYQNPAMNINLATRKDIPTDLNSTGTGFGFIGANSTNGKNSGADSFSFVAEAMKQSKP